jgi:hypothetical protein
MAYVVATAREDDFIKTPEAMRYIEGLQQHLEKLSVVGKTTSVVDYVKRINRVLHDDDPEYDVVPETKEMMGSISSSSQCLQSPPIWTSCGLPFRRANLWVQLKSMGRAGNGEVIKAMDSENCHPINMEFKRWVSPISTLSGTMKYYRTW